MKKLILTIAVGFVLAALCSAQVRTGEVNRGIFYQEGIASWYGKEFNGRPTASGEVFNDAQFTAAHPILPFGTMLKITNQHNNKSVTVRVNDRGPFVAARVIDVSRAAAEQLDMINTGTAPVCIESLSEVSLQQRPSQAPVVSEPARSVPSAPVPYSGELSIKPGETVQVRSASVEPYSGGDPRLLGSVEYSGKNALSFPQAVAGKNYRVQVGAYKQPEYAVEAFEKLKKAGLNPAYEKYGDFYRVIIPGLKQEDLKYVSERLGNAGFKETLVKEE